MSAEGIVRDLSSRFVARQVRRHLVAVTGLEHLPEGPFVLAPNHRSYFDHFVMEVIVRAATGRPVWFLTKRESFERPLSRLWTKAWYGIPVDRDTPSPETLRNVRGVLAGGDVLCVYPEGTRGSGQVLLPFRAGAFRFALAADVPVVPVALTGTADVLRKGERRFRRGGRVEVAFGAPLTRQVGLGKQAAAELLADQARTSVEHLLSLAPQEHRDDSPDRRAAVGTFLEQRITLALDAGGRLARADARRLQLLTRSLSRTEPVAHHVAAQRARLQGLAALGSPVPVRVLRASTVKRGVDQVLRHDPRHRVANYLLGRWHLGMPALLGGSARRAVDAFTVSAAASDPDDVRALVGLADAHAALGDHETAASILRAAAAAPVLRGTRGAERAERLRDRLATLDVGPLPTSTPPERASVS